MSRGEAGGWGGGDGGFSGGVERVEKDVQTCGAEARGESARFGVHPLSHHHPSPSHLDGRGQAPAPLRPCGPRLPPATRDARFTMHEWEWAGSGPPTPSRRERGSSDAGEGGGAANGGNAGQGSPRPPSAALEAPAPAGGVQLTEGGVVAMGSTPPTPLDTSSAPPPYGVVAIGSRAAPPPLMQGLGFRV